MLEEIIEKCIREDRLAQKQLYERYYGKLMVVCRRYAANHDEAVDIFNSGFLKIFNNLRKFQAAKEHNFDAWARRIMVNTAIDYYRSEIKHQSVELEHGLYLEQKNNIIENLSADEILVLINKLPNAYRTAFNMFVLDGFTHQEISKTLGITEGTSKSNLAKARGKLIEMIQGLNQEKKTINHTDSMEHSKKVNQI